uniref:Putative gustatory receptor 93c n=1 Tax=Drosophila melanogaster TaxID=7227 RepID=GR93C_DROME|nr:gustatory receptor 93c [Drosophila melanogaster]Q9VD74.2 RecName: Full=Putative gustatory receptor 93c [Drosophila melanogaster]AAF55925.2 gustatory receptor 93c [Drosophila melanogaster]|eukprot:NP_732665.1 gustatory receptor 93c [Drosophila melanogaster]
MIERLKKVSLPALSAFILFCSCHYGRILGVICFDIGQRTSDDSLVVRNRHQFKWFCLSCRLISVTAVCCFCAPYVADIEDPYERLLQCFRLSASLICGICIIVVQVCYEKELLRMIISFLRLFRRVRRLSSLKRIGFGGKREFFLLLFKFICLVYELYSEICQLWHLPDSLSLFATLCEIFLEIGSLMIIHIGFVGYLSVAALYSEVNSFARIELRRQLRSLERPVGGPVGRKQLRIVEYRVDECISVYDEIERVGRTFHRLLELPVLIILLGKIFATTILSYEVIIRPELYARKIGMWGLVVKSFADVILLTLAVHEAVSSSRMMRRLSLENFPITDHKAWHMKWEMFLSRLNFFEFRVRPLGLFEVSNEVILLFLSSMITYFTYVVQYGIQTNRL